MALTAEGGERKWQKGWGAWVSACLQKHDNQYSYPDSTRVQDSNGRWKVRITCSEHGEFLQAPEKHRFGQGCPICSSTEIPRDAKQRLQATFPEMDWTEVTLNGSKSTLHLVCTKHGEFSTNYNKLMTKAKKQAGITACPACARLQGGVKRRKSDESWKAEILEAMADRNYEYDWTTLDSIDNKLRVICPEHGEFKARKNDLINRKNGCPICAKQARFNWGQNNKLSVDDAVIRATTAKNGRYLYDFTSFISQDQPMRMICIKHGEFKQIYRNHITLDAGCPMCANSVSKGETELLEFIHSLGVKTSHRDRTVLKGKEIDVLLPELRIGIEYCGTYWHSEERLGKEYHKNKLKLATDAGIRLIQIFEDEWLDRQNAVKTRLLHILGKSDKVYARKLKLVTVALGEAAEFYEAVHTQGAGTPARVSYGLRDETSIIACMSFGANRFGPGMEMLRFASKAGVTGGFSRLLTRYTRENPNEDLVSYADLRWSLGEVYKKNRFTLENVSNPGYYWCKGRKRFSRMSMQKHKLKDKLETFNPAWTEVENCQANGFWRIFDCGASKWVYKGTKQHESD